MKYITNYESKPIYKLQKDFWNSVEPRGIRLHFKNNIISYSQCYKKYSNYLLRKINFINRHIIRRKILNDMFLKSIISLPEEIIRFILLFDVGSEYLINENITCKSYVGGDLEPNDFYIY